jgi:ribosome-associated protein
MRQNLAQKCSKENVQGEKQVVVETLNIVKNISDAAEDAKGKEVVILDVSQNFGLADYFIIASARSDRHTQGIANKIIAKLEELGIKPYSVQGMDEGQWVIVDCAEVVVHIFYEPLRHRYDLESLWLNAETVDREQLRHQSTPRAASKRPRQHREAVLA